MISDKIRKIANKIAGVEKVKTNFLEKVVKILKKKKNLTDQEQKKLDEAEVELLSRSKKWVIN